MIYFFISMTISFISQFFKVLVNYNPATYNT